jgi:hypothetical protein
MHIAVFITGTNVTKRAIRTFSRTMSSSHKSNFVAEGSSIRYKDLYRRGLKHTTPPNNVMALFLFLKQRPKTDPIGPSKDNLQRSNSSSIVKNHVIST